MALSEMFAAFLALSDDEAQHVCDLLVEAGIKAKLIESYPLPYSRNLGFSDLKPEVWIDRVDAVRAKLVLDKYMLRGDDWRMATWRQQQKREREIVQCAAMWYAAQRPTGTSAGAGASGDAIEVTCEQCGKQWLFPSVLKGSAEECPLCGALVDIGDDADFQAPDDSLPDSGQQGD